MPTPQSVSREELLKNLSIRIPESTNPIHFSNISPMDYHLAEILRKNLTNREITVGKPPEAKLLEREILADKSPEEESNPYEQVFEKKWEVFDPSKKRSQWSITKEKRLIQTANCGYFLKGKDKNFGTVAINKQRFDQSITSLSARITLGNEGESGVVFNFENSKDYFIFRYFHNDAWNPQDSCALLRVSNGFVKEVGEVKRLPKNYSRKDATLTLRQQSGTDLLCLFSVGNETHQQIVKNVTLTAQSGVGFYSRYCDDAVFHGLQVKTGAVTTVLLPHSLELPEDSTEEYKKEFLMEEVDLRPINWLNQAQQLWAEKYFANERFTLAQQRYKRATNDINITPAELDNHEGYYRSAFNKKIEADQKYQEFKDFLAKQGIHLREPSGSTDVLGNQPITLKQTIVQQRVQTWMEFYIHYYAYNTNYVNRVRHETFMRTNRGRYKYYSWVEDKWCHRAYRTVDQKKEVQVTSSQSLFDNLSNSISGETTGNPSVERDIREYTLVNGEYTDQYGITLQDHVIDITENPRENREDILILSNTEKRLVIKNPVFSAKQLHPPSFLFEENYTLDVGWSGIGLGEFCHSINLFPGESREMQIVSTKKRSWERISKSSSKQSSTASSESTAETKRNDSFESSLQDNFESSAASSQSSTETTNVSVSGEVSAGWGWGRASIKAGYSNNRSNSSNSSTSSMLKKVSNTAKKCSSEVSQNNKVAFSSTSEMSASLEEKVTGEDMESETTKTTIANINEGKTVNYNFFQVTNIYSTKLRIDDVKIHIDTGVEIIPRTGITIRKSYDIEDFGSIIHDLRIYPLADRQEIAKGIAAQILTRYACLKDDVVDDNPQIISFLNGSDYKLKQLRSKCESILFDEKKFVPPLVKEKKNVDKNDEVNQKPKFFQPFPDSLLTVLKLKSTVKPLKIGERDFYTVNSGKYYVDAQVGMKPATEEYLEDRRRIETNRQVALVDELKQRTEKGIFYQPLPDSLTSLSMENGHGKSGEELTIDPSFSEPETI